MNETVGVQGSLNNLQKCWIQLNRDGLLNAHPKTEQPGHTTQNSILDISQGQLSANTTWAYAKWLEMLPYESLDSAILHIIVHIDLHFGRSNVKHIHVEFLKTKTS